MFLKRDLIIALSLGNIIIENVRVTVLIESLIQAIYQYDISTMLLISITFSGALITVLYFSSQMPRTWKFIFDVTTFATKWPLIFLGAILDRVSNVLTFTPNTSEKPRLVIVGASFAGLCALNKVSFP